MNIEPQPRAALEASVSVCNSPAAGAQAGGDWCAVIPITDDLLALTIGDVSGHGAVVAGMMAAMRASVLRACYDLDVPSDVLSVANGVAATLGDGLSVTAIVALVDRRRGTLTFANAGHPPPLLLTGDGNAFLARSPGDLPLGVFPQHDAANYVIALPSDALLVLYTDGITEHARDAIAGEEDLVGATRLAYGLPRHDVARAIMERMFATGRGDDDAAVLAVRATSTRVVPDRRPPVRVASRAT